MSAAQKGNVENSMENMHTDVRMWRVNTVSDKLEKDFALLDSDA